MKLRIKGDSIRLRLTRSEVEQLVASGAVVETTRLPAGASFGYQLRADRPVSAVTAAFEAGVLGVALPPTVAAGWAASEEVAIRVEMPLDGGTLTILVEKDYPCLVHRPGDEDSDAFARDRFSVER